MKKFRFSLGTVLSYKEQVLESLEAEHAAAMADVIMQEEKLAAEEYEYAEYNREFCENKAAGMQLLDALIYESRLRAMEAQIEQTIERLEELKKIEEEKRELVVEAKKETSSLEKLRDKKLEQCQKEVQKSEEQLIEEFVSNARAISTGA